MSHTMARSGNEMFLVDKSLDVSNSLLYKMATTESYLEALRVFKSRRLYANLRNDFVVPLGTAAFLPATLVEELRKKYKHMNGIVEVLASTGNKVDTQNNKCAENESYEVQMINGLDSLQWEKMIVGFDLTFGLLPMAHNKICSLSAGPRYPKFVTENFFRFNEGKYVMENASAWLTAE